MRAKARGALMAFAIAIAAFVTFATAQAPQPPPQPTFRTEANYVRVDVFPTKDGAPVNDLTAADFDVLESGVPQRVEQFEHVVIRGNLPQELRVEPNTVAESLRAAQNPRARVFVVFLDVNHVGVDGSHNIRQPLVDALNKLIGPDDVFAVMTPEMSAADIVFARRTTTIENILARYWTWGERDQVVSRDPQEQQYVMCYPGTFPQQCPDGSKADDRGVADEMIERRREKMTLDALTDLVRYLRGVREERKAVIAVSDGWRLFGRDDSLAHRRVSCTAPAPQQVTVDPRTGRLTGRTPPSLDNGPQPDTCERDRIALAALDDDAVFRALLGDANRSNTSFYPVDPRGLVVFDEPIAKPTNGLPPAGSTTITPLTIDNARRMDRLTALQTLAENTDGMAIVNSNNLAAGFKRVVDDLSSYYLLGYYSTGKLDGKFHAITVRVKRPGVRVRARRGYLASTTAEATTAARRGTAGNGAGSAPDAGRAAAEAETKAVESAVGPLAGYTRDMPLRLQFASGWKPGDGSSATMWVVGEIGAAALVGETWNDGFEATATLATPDDQTVATGRATAARNARTFRMVLMPSAPLTAGEYVLRVSARPAAAGSIPSRETVRLTIGAAPAASGALYVRRGPATGNKDAPTADLRFRRNEQLRVEVPGDAADGVSARLLDRTGKALNVPVTAAVRDEGDGSRWHTAQLALAPLAPGDFVIEIARAGGPGTAGGTGGESRTLAAFRIVP